METSNLIKCEHTCTGATTACSSNSTCELPDRHHDEELPSSSDQLAKLESPRRHHNSDSMMTITEEVPFWLKDLLDEPPSDHSTPPHRSCHRRSSSDSIAYIQKTIEKAQQQEKEDYNNIFPTSVHHQQQQYLMMNNNIPPSPNSRNNNYVSSSTTTTPDNSSKRVKKNSAQQHRARKVQYIAELERSVQVLQVEGYEVSAELEFLDQQNLILGMENRALKQRLDNLSQEQYIKCLEQEMLEREITRLRNLYQQQQQHKQKQQQQQQQQKHYGRNRSKRQDLDSSFAKLSLKNKGTDQSQKAR